ncbi:MAG: hypothetical protein WAW90_00650 [Minisyncoccia bacterium]
MAEIVGEKDVGPNLFQSEGFPLDVVYAIKDLADPNMTEKVPLTKGKAPGDWPVIGSMFPQEGFKATPVYFSCNLENRITFRFSLKVSAVIRDGWKKFVFGCINPDEMRNMPHGEIWDGVDTQIFWVAVGYDPFKRTGTAVFYKEFLKKLREMKKD